LLGLRKPLVQSCQMSIYRIGVNDFPRALVFYRGLMRMLDWVLLPGLELPGVQWQWPGDPQMSMAVVPSRPDYPASAGGERMISLRAANSISVDKAHAVALALGGQCEARPGYEPAPDLIAGEASHEYAAYLRDPEGNLLCVFCPPLG
jgi:catechol 2,3-dioxygenase-like lactoylglutathione lyase family enzyme